MRFLRATALVCAGGLVLALGYIVWRIHTPQVARVVFSPDRYCEMKIYVWYTRDSVISYYESGKLVGTVHLANDFLYDPDAIFACPNKHSVVCVSWPDTFEAAFTIDFAHIHKRDHFDYPLNYVVDYSDFEARACTVKEVDSVRHFIETADLKAFAACTRWGVHAEDEDSRKGMLSFLKEATSFPDKYSSPLILPQEPDPVTAANK